MIVGSNAGVFPKITRCGRLFSPSRCAKIIGWRSVFATSTLKPREPSRPETNSCAPFIPSRAFMRPALLTIPLRKNDWMEIGLRHLDFEAEGTEQAGDEL